MKTPTHIETRLTHGYVGSCAHLDRWASVCNARVTAPQTIKTADGEEASEGNTSAFLLVLSPTSLAMAKKAYRQLRLKGPRGRSTIPSTFTHWLRRAIETNYTSAGCHHEYDCCGCASSYADAYQTKRREFTVIIRRSYNY
jgi:hypothetical protein